MLFPDLDEEAIFVHRSDAEDELGSYIAKGFELEGKEWKSVEHYFQAMKFSESAPAYSEEIRAADSPKRARKLGRRKAKLLRSDWSQVRRVVMTRAIYTRCHTHKELAEALLSTGERKLIESSQYDYFWGCGRDRRGANTYGLVLMDVRRKLRQELDKPA